MGLRSELNGTFTHEELERLGFPVAWSGTKDQGEAAGEEADMGRLIADAKQQLEEAYLQMGRDNELAVKIVDGEIEEIVEVE